MTAVLGMSKAGCEDRPACGSLEYYSCIVFARHKWKKEKSEKQMDKHRIKMVANIILKCYKKLQPFLHQRQIDG